MGINDIIRDFLGIGKHPEQNPRISNPESGKRLPRDIEDDLKAEFKNFNQHNFDSQQYEDFYHLSEDKMFEDLENIFNGLFKGHHFEDMPSFWSFENGLSEPNGKKQPLRDKMLKRPDDSSDSIANLWEDEKGENNQPFSFPHSMFGQWFGLPFSSPSMSPYKYEDKNDRDLDKDFSSGKSNLDDLLPPQNSDRHHVPSNLRKPEKNVFFRSYSQITTKRGEDGVLESQKTIKDSEGNEEVIVSRTIGDQTHTYTKKKDSAGNEEVTEHLVNMNEDDVNKFDDLWNSVRPNQGPLSLPAPAEGQRQKESPQGLVEKLFKDFIFDWKFK